MGIKLAGIVAIQGFFFLTTLLIGRMRDTLQENFGLDGAIYKNILTSQGETWSVEQFLGHLNTMYLTNAVIALVITAAYYLYYENKVGSLGSRRPVWWVGVLVLGLWAVGSSLVLFKLPQGLESGGIIGFTTPFSLLVMLAPYWLSTLLFCEYDVPLSYKIKNAFSGNRS